MWSISTKRVMVERNEFLGTKDTDGSGHYMPSLGKIVNTGQLDGEYLKPRKRVDRREGKQGKVYVLEVMSDCQYVHERKAY